MKYARFTIVAAGLLTIAWAGSAAQESEKGKKVDTRVFEMRTYYAHPGKMTALHARFRDHTNKLFVKHGMTLIGFWIPTDPKGAEETLFYIVAHPSEEAAKKAWDEFRKDPDWLKAKAESEKNGPIVSKVEFKFFNATDYSKIK